MKSSTVYSILATLASQSAIVSATAWAQFCNTNDCNDCGESVSLDNPGCLNESGRQTIKFHGISLEAGTQVRNLVASPSPDCPCEASCQTMTVGAAGVDWTGVFGVISPSGCAKTLPGQSFRFQSQSCKQYSNCPGKRDVPLDQTPKIDFEAEKDLAARGLTNTTIQERSICGSYMQFCNDDYCTQGCGEAVCTTNPGCLNENGRKTIRAVYGNFNSAAKLVVSPTPNCPCQNNCIASTSSCQPIPEGQSYRFVTGQDCDKNNC
jgi:hypothetical protein